MDDSNNPYIFILILAIFAIVELIFLIILYKKNKQENITEEDVISLVNEGHEDGNILASEATMIQNIFEFSDTDVKDIMTHRKSIVAIDGEMLLSEAISVINESNFSRYPVFIDSLDNIIGILHIKDLLNFFNKDTSNIKVKDLREIFSTAESVPETHGINTLFALMQSKKTHMIIVIDEYGQVSGLLSMEDILEEIVGNIEDEHDEKEESIEIKNENLFVMHGSATIEEAKEKLGVELTDEFETMNGYLISLLGKIPEDGSNFTLEDEYFIYEISDVSKKVIGKINVKRKEQPAGQMPSKD